MYPNMRFSRRAQNDLIARAAATSPLYRSVLDHLETYLAERAPVLAPDLEGDGQVDPRTETWDGRHDFPAGDFPA